MKGRPPLPDSERRSQILQARVTSAERETIEAGAEAAGETPAEFLRESALDRARRLLTKRKKRRG